MRYLLVPLLLLPFIATAQPAREALERNQAILREAEAQAQQTEDFVRRQMESTRASSSRRELAERVEKLEQQVEALRYMLETYARLHDEEIAGLIRVIEAREANRAAAHPEPPRRQ